MATKSSRSVGVSLKARESRAAELTERFASRAAAAAAAAQSAQSRETARDTPFAVARKKTGQSTSSSATELARRHTEIGASAGTVGSGAVVRPGDIVAVPPVFMNQFTRRILRPRDLLVLDFTFVNLRIDRSGEGISQLTRISAERPSYIVVGFPAQHLNERAFFETEGDLGSDKPKDTDIPVASRLAEPSRLVFRVPSNFTSIPYQLDELLKACATYELSVAPSATPPESNFLYEVGVGVLDTVAKAVQPVAKRAAVKTRAATGRSAVARSIAAQAYTAAVAAEVQNQWYSKRSPLSRAGAAISDAGKVGIELEKTDRKSVV